MSNLIKPNPQSQISNPKLNDPIVSVFPFICLAAECFQSEEIIMRKSIKFGLFFLAFTILFLAVGSAQAQPETAEKVRLKSPSTVKGEIGGESHAAYVIRVRKGQTLKVQIDWKEKGDRVAHFVVSRSPDFFAGDVIRGIMTYNEKNWYSKIRRTGDYYIYVTAHPVANYTLKVSAK
jgi:hypothetical protein